MLNFQKKINPKGVKNPKISRISVVPKWPKFPVKSKLKTLNHTTASMYVWLIAWRYIWWSNVCMHGVSCGTQHRDVPSAVFDEMKGPFTELGKKCKAASVTECCDAFKEVACPHNTLLNDLDNGRGDDMFYFIHTYGRLPPGTIFKKCVEGPYGMKCWARSISLCCC